MKSDLDFLTKTMAEVHPKLVNGWSEEEKQRINRAYALIKAPLTKGEFFYIADSVIILLHDAQRIFH